MERTMISWKMLLVLRHFMIALMGSHMVHGLSLMALSMTSRSFLRWELLVHLQQPWSVVELKKLKICVERSLRRLKKQRLMATISCHGVLACTSTAMGYISFFGCWLYTWCLSINLLAFESNHYVNFLFLQTLATKQGVPIGEIPLPPVPPPFRSLSPPGSPQRSTIQVCNHPSQANTHTH